MTAPLKSIEGTGDLAGVMAGIGQRARAAIGDGRRNRLHQAEFHHTLRSLEYEYTISEPPPRLHKVAKSLLCPP